MKVSVESPGSTQKRVTIEIDPERVEKELAKSYRELSRHAPVRGFRPGKTPRSVLERLFGKSVREEVKEKLLEEALPEVFKQEKIGPVGPPVLEKSEMLAGGEFQVTILVDVKPEIEPRDYVGIEIKPESVVVTEQEVDDDLEKMRNAHSVLREIEERRPIRKGDVVVVDYEGLDETGSSLAGFKGVDRQIEVGGAGLIPQVDQALEGMQAGETREVGVDFPPEHRNAKIAGKRVLIRVTVKSVKEKVLPTLDDEFAKDVGEFDNLETLRAATREKLLGVAHGRSRARQMDDVVRAILERNPFEVPPSLVEAEVDSLMSTLQSQTGQDVSSWGEEDLARARASLSEPAVFRVRRSLILEMIAEKEGISVADSDLQAYFDDLGKATGQNAAAIKAEFEKAQRIEALSADLRERRVLDFLLGRATIAGDVSPSQT